MKSTSIAEGLVSTLILITLSRDLTMLVCSNRRTNFLHKNSQKISLQHQRLRRRFFVLEHQHGCRELM